MKKIAAFCISILLILILYQLSPISKREHVYPIRYIPNSELHEMSKMYLATLYLYTCIGRIILGDVCSNTAT